MLRFRRLMLIIFSLLEGFYMEENLWVPFYHTTAHIIFNPGSKV
jgi:hypothetical protein